MFTQSRKMIRTLSFGLAAPLIFAFTSTYAIGPLTDFKERESNNETGNVILAQKEDETIRVSGSLDGKNDVDIFVFNVKNGLRGFGAHLSGPVPGGVHVKWMIDKNRNRRADDSVFYSTLVNRMNKEFLIPDGANVLAMVTNLRPVTLDYEFSAVIKKHPTVKITAVFKDAKALAKFDGFGGGAADFRARLTVNNNDFRRRQKVDANNDSPIFNLKAIELVPSNQQFVPIVMSLVDLDPGKDDVADINPQVGGKRSLELEYDTAVKVVRDLNNKTLGNAGQTITVEGTESHKARVRFFVVSEDNFTVVN